MSTAERRMPDEEWSAIAKHLEDYHSVFSKFWSMGKPQITDSISTCAVSFDKAGQQVEWSVNPDFWATLSEQGKLFAIAHECMHVIFSHGVRATELTKIMDLQTVNVAMDIAVNSHLENHYGFKRDEIEPEGVRYVWLDEVLPGEPSGKSFEYYADVLARSNPQSKLRNKHSPQRETGGKGQSGKGDPQTVDDHSDLSKFCGSDLAEMIKRAMDSGTTQEIADMAGTDATPEMRKSAASAAKGLRAGTSPGNTVLEISSAQWISPKPKWESVIKKWVRRALEEYADAPTWTQQSRRVDPAIMGGCMLPAIGENEAEEKNRIRVSFFLDTSGSCISYAERFFKAARTLNPRKFDIKLYCFDHRVYETDIRTGKVYGGGGTSFNIIERRIQREMSGSGAAYPDAVWILTDGWGDEVFPEKPKRWHWFLTSGGYRGYIHKDSNVHVLSKFE